MTMINKINMSLIAVGVIALVALGFRAFREDAIT